MAQLNESQTLHAALPPLIVFPSTEPADLPPESLLPPRRPPHLPFRRISLPAVPSPVHQNRMSVVSTLSFDSPPEPAQPAKVVPSPATPKPSPRKSRGRPASLMVGSGANPATRRAHSRQRDSELPPIDIGRQLKRTKVINEILETERAYVDGLELIYSLFLTPLLDSLQTSQPLVSRTELTSIFSNFIDIWNLHRAFYSSLSHLLAGQSTLPPISEVLHSHFPYLSLYNPFITAFPTVLASLSALTASSPPFAEFLRRQEANPRCGKLALRDWLLTIVQRCPRYLLLLKDLIACTDPEDPEYNALTTVHTLLSKITQSLNSSLQTHAQILSLLSIQKCTPNLPFPLIIPGRSLLKRGTLLQVDRDERFREFLLFSDCLIWLSKGGEREWGSGVRGDAKKGVRPPWVTRNRSSSDAEMPAFRALAGSLDGEERWWYRGRAQLMDIEVITSPVPPPGEESRFDLLSPESSFTLYAATPVERDAWTTAIRGAKYSQLMALSTMHPNSTLTSSSSTNHLRRTLQALPYAPEEEPGTGRRNKVEHFVPAIWVPDGKTQSCMRCSRNFSWRRRRHHCRLCGRCVCADCSGRTFFISDPDSKVPTKPARACNACYETVFPIVSPPAPPEYSIGTLSAPPSSQSMPSLALPTSFTSKGRPGSRGSEDRSMPPSSFFRQSSPSLSRLSVQTTSTAASIHSPTSDVGQDASMTPPLSTTPSQYPSLPSTPEARKAARKANRFSLPAIGLHTAPVTTRAAADGEGRTRRFSLVLGGKSQIQKKKDKERETNNGDLNHGIAASKLSELLGRTARAA